MKQRINKMVLSAMFLGIGLVLPLVTGQIKEIGDSLLPMHLPVMLCGLICGYKYGLFIGAVMPFLRSVTFGMPPIYPNAVWMAVELAAYGFVIGFLYCKLNRKNVKGVYISLLCAMVLGRIAWGITKAVLLGLGGKAFTVSMFLVGGFADALPGIILQLVLIPLIMTVVNKMKILK